MLADHLFHPDHIVPLRKFIAGIVEFADEGVSEFFMETHAVKRQMFVLMFGTADTGVEV